MSKAKTVFVSTFAFLFGLAFAQQPSSFATATPTQLDSGLINAHYQVRSNHSAFIFNPYTSYSNYIYSFALCAQNCTTYVYNVGLEGHRSINVSFIINKDVIYTQAGRYTLTAKTTIIGPGVNVLSQGNTTAVIINPNVLPHR